MGNICDIFSKQQKKRVTIDTPESINVNSHNIPIGTPVSYMNDEPPPYNTINTPIIMHHQNNNNDGLITGVLAGMVLSDILEDTY